MPTYIYTFYGSVSELQRQQDSGQVITIEIYKLKVQNTTNI